MARSPSLFSRDIFRRAWLRRTRRKIAVANSASANRICLREICSSRRAGRRCGIKSGNLRVSRHLSGGLTRSWIVPGLSAAAGRVQIGESFTLPLPPLELGAAAAAPNTPWGGLTRFWRVQLIGGAAGREGFGGRTKRTCSMSVLEEKAQCGSHEDREAAGVRAFRLAE